MTKYNENNFFELTAAVFDVCETPDREPDYVSGSGSAYWYENDGVIRRSDHWGGYVASCKWWLRGFDMKFSSMIEMADLLDEFGDIEVSAFCKFDAFRDVNEFREEWDKVKKEIGFKVNPLF